MSLICVYICTCLSVHLLVLVRGGPNTASPGENNAIFFLGDMISAGRNQKCHMRFNIIFTVIFYLESSHDFLYNSHSNDDSDKKFKTEFLFVLYYDIVFCCPINLICFIAIILKITLFHTFHMVTMAMVSKGSNCLYSTVLRLSRITSQYNVKTAFLLTSIEVKNCKVV